MTGISVSGGASSKNANPGGGVSVAFGGTQYSPPAEQETVRIARVRTIIKGGKYLVR
jgi:hypothetical protein